MLVSAAVTTLALTTLEGEAHSGALRARRAGVGVVTVAAWVALVTLATLEGEASTSGAGSAVATSVAEAATVGGTGAGGGVAVSAAVASLALTTLEGIAHTTTTAEVAEATIG